VVRGSSPFALLRERIAKLAEHLKYYSVNKIGYSDRKEEGNPQVSYNEKIVGANRRVQQPI
jgi:hypothetical protein